MTPIEEISAIAGIAAVVALANWLGGDRSFLGRLLLIRQGPFWVASRWMGLGLWLASVIASTKTDMPLEIAGLVGAALLLFGTARRASARAADPHSVEAKGI